MKQGQPGTFAQRVASSYKGQQTQNGSVSSPSPLVGPAAYTLPGVISYLTSEFTNLERYKIVNNIEKSEMKFKIQLMASEVNTLKFINNKQALRIKELEALLVTTTLSSTTTTETKTEVNSNSSSNSSSNIPTSTTPFNSSSSTGGDLKEQEIPSIDLQVLRDSRLRLNKAIREALKLLKPPTAAELLNEYNMNGQWEFDKLLDRPNSSSGHESSGDAQHREGVFSLYTLGNNDPLARVSESLGDGGMQREEVLDVVLCPVEETTAIMTPGEISESETVIVDEPDVARLLIEEPESYEKSGSPLKSPTPNT